MPLGTPITCWVVTDGKPGMENQCRGLAEALGLDPTVKRVKPRAPWRQLSPWLRLGLRYAYRSGSDKLEPPWPDLLIATGRASILASLYVRRASALAGRRTLTVQLQDPAIAPSYFDLLIVPRHDGLTGPNIVTTTGGLHRITRQRLNADAAKLLPHVAQLPGPRVAVVIGGASAVHQLTPAIMRPIAEQLAQLARDTGGSLLVTPSRRTGDDNVQVLREVLRDTPAFIWDGAGDNPYFGLLGLADAILVTSDSVNMASEAAMTGKPVYIIDLPGGSAKFRRFHQALRDDGITRPFAGRLERWSYKPLDDMGIVTERVRTLLQARLATTG